MSSNFDVASGLRIAASDARIKASTLRSDAAAALRSLADKWEEDAEKLMAQDD